MKTRATILAFVVVIGLSIALPPPLGAFSVGEIAVQSFRGMPFLAEIPLLLEPQERSQGVVVTLGDAGEYRSEGLTRSVVIDSLRATVMPGARDVISLSSTTPIQAAAFDVLLLVRAGHITIVKTYHVVLPPPPAPPAPQMAKTPADATPPRPEQISAPPVSAPPKKTPSKPPAPAWEQRLPARYGPIERGATLYSVVEALGVPKELFWQAIVLIWQANKQAFVSGNLHGLRQGQTLTVPADFDENLAALGRAEAQRVIAEAWENWQALRQDGSGEQQVKMAREEPAALTNNPTPTSEQVAFTSEPGPTLSEKLPALQEKIAAPSEVLSTPSGKTASASMPTFPKEKVTANAAVVLPAKSPLHVVEVTELRSVLQGLEELLTRRLPQGERGKEMTTFVNAGELQTALQGLEERLMLRLQESLAQATIPQRRSQPIAQASASVGGSSFLEDWLPTHTMVYVLAVENALLLLLAIGILWRWYRSRA